MTRIHRILPALLPVLLFASCGGGGGSAPAAPITLQVRIVLPADTVYTHAAVPFRVEIAGGTPDAVEVLVDEIPVFPLAGPPWEFSFDSTQFTEAEHAVVVRALVQGSVFRSPTRRVVVDRTAPVLLTRTPTPLRTDVAPSEAIVATVSEALLDTSLNATTLRINDRQGNGQTVAPALSPDGQTLTLRITNPIVTPGELTVFLLPGITDLAGNPLQGPADPWTFQLPGWVALGGPLHGGATTNAFTPALARGNGEEWFVAWQDGPGSSGQTTILVQRRGAAGAFEPVGTPLVGSALSNGAAAPTLVVDRAGRPVVAWEEAGQDGSRIYAARWDGAAWQPLASGFAGQTNLPAASHPSLALDDADQPLVAWYERLASTGRQEILVARFTGTTWSLLGAPFSARPGATDAFSPCLRYLPATGPVVAFDEGDGGTGSDVFVLRFDGANWQPLGGALRGQAGNLPAYSPSLALRSASDLAVAFTTVTGLGVSGVQVARWNGSTWQRLGGDVNAVPGLTGAGQPSLALASDGTAFVALSEVDPSDVQDVFVLRFDGQAWGVLANGLSPTPGSSPAVEPSLQLDAADVPVVAFRESRSQGSPYQSIFVLRQNH